jgi:hypothetical protein
MVCRKAVKTLLEVKVGVHIIITNFFNSLHIRPDERRKTCMRFRADASVFSAQLYRRTDVVLSQSYVLYICIYIYVIYMSYIYFVYY